MMEQDTERLEEICKMIRIRTIKTSASAKIPHLGSCLSCIELLVTLYWSELAVAGIKEGLDDRDRFVLSKGHGAPVLFQVLAAKGFYPEEELKKFGVDGSLFHEHPPKPGLISGIEAATGSLGHGFPMALGMALANKIKNQSAYTYALLSDGECNEGSIWEAALLASKLKVNKLTGIIDFNKWQATGRSQDITSLDPLATKWRSFGWHCVEVNGHDIQQIKDALKAARLEKEKPSMIVAHTIKGKGVSFMEDDNNWHYRTPNPEELHKALEELESCK